MEKHVPEIRFEGFSGEWEKIKFSEIFNEKDGIRRGPFGGSIKKEMFVAKSDYVVYEQRNAIYDRYDTRYNISKEKYQELINFSLASGDFIMSGAGTIGRVSRVPDDVKQGVFNQAIIRMKINDERVDSEFFLQWIRSEKMQERLTESNPASAMVNLVPMSELKAWSVEVPNKDEQIAIGNTFQKLDALISQHHQKHNKLSSIKKAMLEKMFPKQGETNPEIRFKGFSGEWETSTLGCLVSFYKGKGLPKSSIQDDGIYSCVHYGELFTKYSEVIDLVTSRTNQSDSFFSMPNDVLMPTSDVTPKGLVKPCCVKQSGIVLGGDILVIRPNNQNVIDGSFLSRFIRAREQQVLQNVTGSTVFHLYASSIEGLGIVFPSIDEQKVITNHFQKLDALINQHQQQIIKLNNIKQACLSKMFV